MNALLVSHRASSAVWVATSVHRQPFVPLHRATALCGCLYASLHNDFVRPLSCILARPAQCEFAPQHQKSRAMPVCVSGSVAGCRIAVVWVAASVHRQPFVPLHRATALCGCLYASLHNDFVRPLSCILCTFMNALLVSHPCETLGVHFIRHPCLTRKLRVLPPAAPKIIPHSMSGVTLFGADGGGRTRTVLLPTDFESVTSANSITSAY